MISCWMTCRSRILGFQPTKTNMLAKESSSALVLMAPDTCEMLISWAFQNKRPDGPSGQHAPSSRAALILAIRKLWKGRGTSGRRRQPRTHVLQPVVSIPIRFDSRGTSITARSSRRPLRPSRLLNRRPSARSLLSPVPSRRRLPRSRRPRAKRRPRR